MNKDAWRIYETKCRKYETLSPKLQIQLFREAMAEAAFAAYTVEKCMAAIEGVTA